MAVVDVESRKVWRSRLKSLMVTICCYDILRRQFVTANVNILRPLKRFSELGKRPLMSSCCRRWIGREVIGWFCHFDWWWVLRVISIGLATRNFPFAQFFLKLSERFLRCKLLTSLRLIRTKFFIFEKNTFVPVVGTRNEKMFYASGALPLILPTVTPPEKRIFNFQKLC